MAESWRVYLNLDHAQYRVLAESGPAFGERVYDETAWSDLVRRFSDDNHDDE
jgi:hypothetical protein